MTTHDRHRPPDRIRGFHAPSPDDRQSVDPILLVDSDSDTCRMIAHHLARAGYTVEWTLDPAVVAGRVATRRYSLLLADEPLREVAAIDPELPVLRVDKPIDVDALVALVRAGVREPKET